MASKETSDRPEHWPRIKNALSEASAILHPRRGGHDDGLSIPARPAIDPATALPEARPPRQAQMVAQEPPAEARPGPEPPRRAAEPGSRRPPPILPARDEARRLTVGPGIALTGDIAACEHLVVEGSVTAKLADCRTVEIAETGLFSGSAAIDEADIRGRFEGDLVARKRLLVRSSGRVTGSLRYGQLEIERGGRISGDVEAQAAPGDADADAAWPAPSQRMAGRS